MIGNLRDTVACAACRTLRGQLLALTKRAAWSGL